MRGVRATKMIRAITSIFSFVISINVLAQNHDNKHLARYICQFNENSECKPSEFCIEAVESNIEMCMEKASKEGFDVNNINTYYKYLRKCSIENSKKLSGTENQANSPCI